MEAETAHSWLWTGAQALERLQVLVRDSTVREFTAMGVLIANLRELIDASELWVRARRAGNLFREMVGRMDEFMILI